MSSLATNSSIVSMIGTGVITGDKLLTLFRWARDSKFAIPAVNCINSTSVCAVLEAAREANSPVIIQFSNGGSAFVTGKGLSNKNQAASVSGSIAGGMFVRYAAKLYGVPVVLHSDHCAHKLLPWFDGMLDADEEYFHQHGEPLFSSHMLDLSEEKLEDNIALCEKYLSRMAKINCFLEMELGITGGEEDGVDNSHVDAKNLYTQPEEVWQVYSALSKISHRFSIAAAFGNVHGVYKPGNVKLSPHLLGAHQKFIAAKLGCQTSKPVFFVFHGGSGSEKHEIKEAISNGVVKMNIDTDTQWAFWNGLREYESKNRAYLQGQIGNPKGPDKPNKKKYDPRAWLRASQISMKNRVVEAFKDLGSYGVLGKAVTLNSSL